MTKVRATLVIAKVEQLWHEASMFSKFKNVWSERDVVAVARFPNFKSL